MLLELPIWLAGIGLGCLLRWINVKHAIIALLAGGVGIGAAGAALHGEPLEAKLLPFDILQGILASFVGYYGMSLLSRFLRQP